ncbi:class I SAM-dependent methyltransferase [Mycobacteroides abscessus]|uniref:class I SAM-dependent methyltransferase n=1 Tax=Mycobacteroides abscessus TaxID=36809 RepID=UPI000C26BFF7|nr:class I SAM-dependent methyltransferase [Mycobacteroides abscessus]MBE5459759.1 hypothetical protein [Mycobacteroides abscessus]QOF43794.1 hypothetical protein E3G69_002843 [Mycobacteroides abscessus]QOF48492.1 hypothetical protein E3G70_002841 [Mycobacteroides abscessus]
MTKTPIHAGEYALHVGDADAERLRLLGQFYDPSSAAFLESAGVAPGDSIIDVGCGHGGVSERMARLVGETGTVYALDASADQLQIARKTLVRHANVTFINSALEDDPLAGHQVNWVYSRFLLMHVADLQRALEAMAAMLTDDGALLLEIADVGNTRFQPSHPDSDHWRHWWYALGKARGLCVDVADTIAETLDAVGFRIERRDRVQPITSSRAAKLLHALGVEQCVPAFLAEVNAPAAHVEAQRRYLAAALDDPDVTIALYDNTQYIARRM